MLSQSRYTNNLAFNVYFVTQMENQSKVFTKKVGPFTKAISYIIIKEKFWLRMGKFAKTLSLLVQIITSFLHIFGPL